MVQLPTEFRTTLESYRGPLDLLLYLIKKEELDILDIPISRITEQYLLYIQVLNAIDPNICGEFLVMASQLMEIKSRELLPVETDESEEAEELDDPRLELVLQLLEYKKYKERALLLERLAEEHGRRHRRPPQDLSGLLAEETGPVDIGKVSVWDLLTAFHKVQIAVSQRQPHRVLFEDRPIEEYVRDVDTALRRARAEMEAGVAATARVLFEDLFAGASDRFEAVGFFLAILEMAKQGRLRFYQEELFGPIELELVESENAGDGDGAPEAAEAVEAAEEDGREPPPAPAG